MDFKIRASEDKHQITYRVLITLAVSVMIVCVLLQTWLAFGIEVWRHDAAYYLNSYLPKLKTEGRWVNYLVFPFVKEIPGQFAALLCQLCLGFFVYKAAVTTSQRKAFSLLIALTALNIPFLSTQLNWPSTSLPSFIVLALSAATARRIPAYLYFPTFAILFFGTMSHFYFLLPLLFLRELTWKQLILLGLNWCLSFIAAYLFTQGVTHVITGQFIEVANWRKPNPVASFADLKINSERVLLSLKRTLLTIGGILGISGLIGASICLITDRHLKTEAPAILMMFACGMAIYASVIPIGLGVQERTALVLAISLLFMAAIRINYSPKGSILLVAAMLVIGVNLAQSQFQQIQWYSGVTSTFKNQFAKALPRNNPEAYSVTLAVTPKTWEHITQTIEYCEGWFQVTGERFRGSYRVAQAAKELGFQDIGWCNKCPPQPSPESKDKANCAAPIFRPRAQRVGDQTRYILFASDGYLGQ